MKLSKCDRNDFSKQMKREDKEKKTKILKNRVQEIENEMRDFLEKKKESKKAHEKLMEKYKRLESKLD